MRTPTVLLEIVVVIFLVFKSGIAVAIVPDSVCDRVREFVAASGSPWVGIDQKGTLTSIKPSELYREDLLNKIVYLHMRPDQATQRTVASVKIVFTTNGNYLDKNRVRAGNNLKPKPVTRLFEIYQSFHQGQNEDFQLKVNFHMSASLFNRRIPFTTFEPEERRRQLLFPDQAQGKEQTYRAYLLTLKGVAKNGSCVDFNPFFPNGVIGFSAYFADLLPETKSGNFYQDSISARLKK